MFNNVVSLSSNNNSAPVRPATTLAPNCQTEVNKLGLQRTPRCGEATEMYINGNNLVGMTLSSFINFSIAREYIPPKLWPRTTTELSWVASLWPFIIVSISLYARVAHGRVPCLVGCQGPGHPSLLMVVITKIDLLLNVDANVGTSRTKSLCDP